VLWLLSHATGIEVNADEGDETGLEFGDSTTVTLVSIPTCFGPEPLKIEVADEDSASFDICACKLAAMLAPVLRLLLTLPVLDGGLDSGWESKIWT
jgi:hypothetical protein